MRVRSFALVIACAAWGLALGALPAAAEKRVALVIGNGAYQKVGRLANSTNDAMAIAGMLKAAGFDEVELHQDLGIRQLRKAVGDFSDIARDADTAIVYYSGHGIEVDGVNYLIPIDAVLDRDIDVPYESYSLDNLLKVLEPAKRLRLVMLDACRDNPFLRSMKRSSGTRAVGRGLAAVEPVSVNSLVAYAAKAGSFALDGEGGNSPYATAVLNHLATPGLDLRIAFGRVRDEVLKTTKNKQEPFLYGSLGGGNVSIVDAPAGTAAAPPVSIPIVPIDRAAQAWMVTKDTGSVAVLEDFVRQYAGTPYASMARARLEELKKDQAPVAAPPQRSTAAAPPTNDAERAWAVIQGTTSVAVLEDFIRQFGSTPYGSMARARVEELKKSQVAAVPPPTTRALPAPNQPNQSNQSNPPENKASTCSGKIAGSWDVSTAVTFPATLVMPQHGGWKWELKPDGPEGGEAIWKDGSERKRFRCQGNVYSIEDFFGITLRLSTDGKRMEGSCSDLVSSVGGGCRISAARRSG